MPLSCFLFFKRSLHSAWHAMYRYLLKALSFILFSFFFHKYKCAVIRTRQGLSPVIYLLVKFTVHYYFFSVLYCPFRCSTVILIPRHLARRGEKMVSNKEDGPRDQGEDSGTLLSLLEAEKE